MALPNSIIRNMAGGPAGSLVVLPKPCRQIKITCETGGACLVRAQVIPANGPFTPPVAPTSTPQPGAGTASAPGWVPLAAGDTWTSRLQLFADGYQYVEVWETAAGNLVVEAVD